MAPGFYMEFNLRKVDPLGFLLEINFAYPPEANNLNELFKNKGKTVWSSQLIRNCYNYFSL